MFLVSDLNISNHTINSNPNKMKILQVPILFCFRCGTTFAPRIDTIDELVIIPKACPKRDCRSQTWNIPDDELDMIRQTQNKNLLLGPGYRRIIKKKVPVLDKCKPKKSEKKSSVVCLDCELFFYDLDGLKAHQQRRHHGMCMKCHASNVYVIRVNNTTICKTCFESKRTRSKNN